MSKGNVSDKAIEERPAYFYRGCAGKKGYSSKRSALGIRRAMGDDTLEAYKCKLCKRWHLGHNNRRTNVQST